MNNQSLSSNKSVSLPKLKTHTDAQKKPLQEFHKINWSVAPRCLIEGHQSQSIIYVCINPECQHTTRLVCEHCFYKNHCQHNKEFLAVDEIKNGHINALRYWPFDQQYKPMYQFIKKHDAYIQNLIQDIKSTFDNFLFSVAKAIKDVQTRYLEKVTKFYQKSSKKKQYVSNLIKGVQNSFQIKQIQENVGKIFNKEIRHDVFMKNMKKVLNNKNKEIEKIKLKEDFQNPQIDKGADMEFDKIYFLKKQKIIIAKIEEQEKAFKEVEVVTDEAQTGLEWIITQTIQYLGKNATGLHPLMFETKNLDDGTFYQGFVHKNNRVLLGMRDYKNGNVYFGQWKNNCRSGWGVYQHKENGYKYAGNWKQDKKNGFGKQITPHFTYEGQFKEDKKQGFGMIRQEGVRYDITWKNDKKHGKGKRIDNDGETEVYFLNGVEPGGAKLPGTGGDGQTKRDVSFLAKMFAQKSNTK